MVYSEKLCGVSGCGVSKDLVNWVLRLTTRLTDAVSYNSDIITSHTHAADMIKLNEEILVALTSRF